MLNPGNGRFCANCGASLETTTCAGCNASLSPGARFCHRCGRPVGAGMQASRSSRSARGHHRFVIAMDCRGDRACLPARVFRRATTTGPRRAARSTLRKTHFLRPASTTALHRRTAAKLFVHRISHSSRREERADRLFNRVMMLNSQGKSDSVMFFAQWHSSHIACSAR